NGRRGADARDAGRAADPQEHRPPDGPPPRLWPHAHPRAARTGDALRRGPAVARPALRVPEAPDRRRRADDRAPGPAEAVRRTPDWSPPRVGAPADVSARTRRRTDAGPPGVGQLVRRGQST